jgi:hypothetical protein
MRRHGVAPGGGAGAPAEAAMSRQAKSHEHSPIRLTFPLQQQGQQCDQLALGRARLPGGTATSWGSIGGT